MIDLFIESEFGPDVFDTIRRNETPFIGHAVFWYAQTQFAFALGHLSIPEHHAFLLVNGASHVFACEFIEPFIPAPDPEKRCT